MEEKKDFFHIKNGKETLWWHRKKKKYATMGEYVGGNMISAVHKSREMFK